MLIQNLHIFSKVVILCSNICHKLRFTGFVYQVPPGGRPAHYRCPFSVEVEVRGCERKEMRRGLGERMIKEGGMGGKRIREGEMGDRRVREGWEGKGRGRDGRD